MHSISFPTRFLPGTTDNFVSNEVIAKDLTVFDIWHYLVDTAKWELYYDNAANIKLTNGKNSELHYGEHFHFDTFGFPIDAQVMELISPTKDAPIAKIAWHGWNNDSAESAIDVYHAFLIEQLPANRVRLLTQESQIGNSAAKLAITKPNPMLNGHQAWLDGLVSAARKQL
ncbi:SRPBCC domain-containing protein [Limosilactobacillus allomucosae]|uniref:SRPBCC domain-containing protein n=1 Tax=Limosilactobacillus allomucosae TaxID=3142938 RepID=A0AAU7BZT6_9LACO